MTKQDIEHYLPAKRARAARVLSHLDKVSDSLDDPESPVVTPNADYVAIASANLTSMSLVLYAIYLFFSLLHIQVYLL